MRVWKQLKGNGIVSPENTGEAIHGQGQSVRAHPSQGHSTHHGQENSVHAGQVQNNSVH